MITFPDGPHVDLERDWKKRITIEGLYQILRSDPAYAPLGCRLTRAMRGKLVWAGDDSIPNDEVLDAIEAHLLARYSVKELPYYWKNAVFAVACERRIRARPEWFEAAIDAGLAERDANSALWIRRRGSR